MTIAAAGVAGTMTTTVAVGAAGVTMTIAAAGVAGTMTATVAAGAAKATMAIAAAGAGVSLHIAISNLTDGVFGSDRGSFLRPTVASGQKRTDMLAWLRPHRS
jgi:hypothetical protein